MEVLRHLLEHARARAAAIDPGSGPVRSAGLPLGRTVRGRGRLSVIAEFKRCSPGHGELNMDTDPVAQAMRYVRAGASAVSVLTEPTRFGGREEDLRRIAEAVPVPVLMKDFVVDAAQVRRAAVLGASAVLLIARCLPGPELPALAAACRDHGMEALIECHDVGDLGRALAVEDALIGINNRDLSTLGIDRGTAPRLLPLVPGNRVAVAESGYETPAQTGEVRGRADAVLVGAMLMSAEDPGALVREMAR